MSAAIANGGTGWKPLADIPAVHGPRHLTGENRAQYRNVYDFCNRFSHGQGRETQVMLDAWTVSQQLRRCLEFLRDVDCNHYTEMCRATGRAHNDPLQSKP